MAGPTTTTGERVIGGRYLVGRKIAEGGMGVVYEATHMLSKKVVALKVLSPAVGRDETTRQRFLREVAAPAQIGHDGIVEIYDAGFDDHEKSLFVAMELLQGSTLRDRLSRGRMPYEKVLDLFEAMLQPLAAAHRAGIVHRDLKPENVFLHTRRDGTEVVKILDFGIARDLAGQDTVTQAGTAMGTPHYMSPEQAMSARDVSFTTDVWALGVILYEALSGATPFAGDTIATIVVEICTKPHRPTAEAAPGVSPAVAALVDRCLDKDAPKRPQNAGEMLVALRNARGSRPAQAAQVPVTADVARVTAPTMAAQVEPPRPTSGARPMPTPATMPMQQVPAITPQATPAPFVPPTAYSAPSSPHVAMGSSPSMAVASSPSQPAMPATQASPMPPGPYGAPSYPAMSPAPVSPPAMHVGPQEPPRRAWLTPLVIIGSLGCLGVGGFVFLLGGLAVIGALAGDTIEVDGRLEPSDHGFRRGQLSDEYSYTWSAGDRVVIDASSNDFDPALVVRTPSGREIDDDGRGGSHARVELTLDEGGMYLVIATSARPGMTGTYHLRVDAR
jgi:serine/threonine-protein kinase